MTRKIIAVVAAFGFASACSPRDNAPAPTAPSAVQQTRASAAIAVALGSTPVGPADVSFPPRNEPLLFRTALETKYRDGLRRNATQSYVDQEGSVVWTQEYLRYRTNLCDHPSAVTRVLAQVDGLGIQPPCGLTSRVSFPPRNEPLDFMRQLEAKYRDGLGRSPQSTYVDVEGNVIWIQEYLRYRVSGCDHLQAQDKVFTQIDGRGVPNDCSVTEISGSVNSLGGSVYDVTVSRTGTLSVVLTWSDGTVDLDLLLTPGPCRSNCLILQRSQLFTGTRESINHSVRAGETYTIWVVNFTSRSATFQLTYRVSPGDAIRTSEAVPSHETISVGAAMKKERERQ